jgi:hypothetical protein
MKIKPYNDFTWWLNLNQSSNIKDNQFVVAKNMFYNNSQQIQSRRWYRKFGNNVWSAPITSYFFFQRDDTLESIAIMFSGGVMYKYDESWNTWTSIKTWLFEFETLPWETNKRTRWDFAVYKNVIYMCDGVNTYASFDWTTYTSIGVWSAITGTTGDNTTDTFTKSTHWLVDWDEVYLSLWTLPTWITSWQVYYVIGSTANTFKISTSKNWSAVNFTTNWSWFSVYKLSQPRCRYISYLFNAIFGAWSDGAPSTLYHTEWQPLDWNNISYTEVVIWWDEIWRINWISEHWQLVTVFKDQKIYTYLPWQEVNPIDSQTWWYSDRTIHSIGNTLAYFNERWIDALQNRSWVWWVSAIESKPLSDNVRSLIELIKADNYRSCVSWYIKETNNYYFSFDTNGDDIPDTTLVYNSLVWAWTEYIYPEIYDYGWYIDSDWDRQYIITSWSWWQCFEYEYWYDDVGTKIETELQTKPRDNDDPAQVKEYSFVDVTGRKEDTEEPLNIDIIVWWEVIRSVTVDSSNLNTSEQSIRISTTPISIAPVWWWDDINDNKILYKYSVKIPLYSRWIDMSVRLSASWVQWILEKIRVWYDNSTIELFNYNNIK